MTIAFVSHEHHAAVVAELQAKLTAVTEAMRRLHDAAEAVRRHPSDHPNDATWTEDQMFFLTPEQHAERALRSALENARTFL